MSKKRYVNSCLCKHQPSLVLINTSCRHSLQNKCCFYFLEVAIVRACQSILYYHYFSLHLFWYSFASEPMKSHPDMHCICERIIAFKLGLGKKSRFKILYLSNFSSSKFNICTDKWNSLWTQL